MASFSQGISAQPVHAPRWPAQASLAAAVVAVALVPGVLVLDGRQSFTCAVLGYVIGALATPVFVQIYRFLRSARSRIPTFNPSAKVDRLATVAISTGILGGAVHAFFIATELAK
jgi:hypothetical protein